MHPFTSTTTRPPPSTPTCVRPCRRISKSSSATRPDARLRQDGRRAVEKAAGPARRPDRGRRRPKSSSPAAAPRPAIRSSRASCCQGWRVTHCHQRHRTSGDLQAMRIRVGSLGCDVTVSRSNRRAGRSRRHPPGDHAANQLISIMHSNNESARFSRFGEIARIAREHRVSCMPMRPSRGQSGRRRQELGVDFFRSPGTSFMRPRGSVDLLRVRGNRVPSFIHGAGQEGGRQRAPKTFPTSSAWERLPNWPRLAFPDSSEHCGSSASS